MADPARHIVTDREVREFLLFAGYRVGSEPDALRFSVLMRWAETRMGAADKRTARRQLVIASLAATLIGAAIMALAGAIFPGGWTWLIHFR